MPSEILKINKLELSEAIMKINALKQQVQQEGNVDSEIHMFEIIIHKLETHEISGEEAISQAEHIVNRRQNYH
jgi:hypothetical protein